MNVMKMREWIQVQLNVASITFSCGGPSHQFRNFVYNLVLIFAYSVLKDTLLEMQDKNVFVSKKTNLGFLMKKSKSKINWIDFEVLDQGREIRNQIAHENKIIKRVECWKYIDAIDAQLIAWDVFGNE